jgi:hypothetical protein
MSRFLDAIRAGRTGRRAAILEPLSCGVRKVESRLDPFQTTEEYEFKVEWRARAFCQQQDFDGMMKNIYRELQEVVYGDLRERILRLERAIYEQDRAKVLVATRDIMREIME